MKYIEVKEILDNCYDNISNLQSLINSIEIYHPKEFKEYNDYYDSFIDICKGKKLK